MHKWLIKENEASVNGKYPGAREMEEHIRKGIIILDKPRGPTSHIVDKHIKDITGIEKLSHGGTLDPPVSGVLVIPLLESTKLMPILLSSRKEYVGIAYLHKPASEDKILDACNELKGIIKQTPPKRSAVARREREREIYDLEVLEIKGQYVLIRVVCEAGTYIRRLCEQIGWKLDMGAHMVELRRTKSNGFTEDDCVNLQDVFDAFVSDDDNIIREIVQPLELIGNGAHCVVVGQGAILNLCNGSPLYVGGVVRVTSDIQIGDYVLMYSVSGEMIGFGVAKMTSEQMILENKGVAVKTDRIIKIER
ncbi:MAG: RNA-guided pseudouridylation complex pseudouridine synthase subunit Cbf5 [Nanoarchaeota archaeon]|nr:RNA-guided pseudouridylation complex pseudouridine synthase subunit Cbf5 [Nanoarchaeota archaeon]